MPVSRRRSCTRPGAFLIALGLAACANGPTDPEQPNTQQQVLDSLVLAPGQETLVQTLRLSFLNVSADSRCAIDVVCVWQGNAAVEVALAVGTGPSQPFTLNTAEGRPTAVFAGYQVTLVGLLPAARSDRQIRPADYRASLLVAVAE